MIRRLELSVPPRPPGRGQGLERRFSSIINGQREKDGRTDRRKDERMEGTRNTESALSFICDVHGHLFGIYTAPFCTSFKSSIS